MNRVTRGTVVLAAALAALSCKGDPTDSLRNGVDKLVANPSAIFLRPDSTKGIIVEALDEQGNRQATNFNIAANPTGVTLVEDTAYNIVYDVDGNAKRPSPWTRARYEVTATAQFGNTSFTINAGGKSLVIPIRILPDTATSVTLSNAAPNLGDTVTATVGAGFKFTPASAVTVAGATVVTLGINADSTQISFLSGPSANGAISVSNLMISYGDVGGYTATSGGVTFTTPTIASVAATFSSATPAAGAALTITLPAGYKFVSGAGVTFGGDDGFGTAVAPDSNSITTVPPPGFTGAPDLANIALDFLLGAAISVPTASNVTVGAGLAGTDDPNTAPALPIPGPGTSVVVYDNGDPFAAAIAGEDRVYAITLGAPTTLQINLAWNNGADVDLLAVDGGVTGFICGFAGATGANPENLTCALPAGTSYLIANLYAGTAPAIIRWTITQP